MALRWVSAVGPSGTVQKKLSIVVPLSLALAKGRVRVGHPKSRAHQPSKML